MTRHDDYLIAGALRRVRVVTVDRSRNSRTRCMACSKKPVVACHWANGHGMAWFCLKHFKSWAKEDDRDIVGVWFIKDGEVPKDIRKTPPGTEKVRKLGQKASLGVIFSRLEKLIERGGPGSGHRGHRGRPGEVGGSLPSTAGAYAGTRTGAGIALKGGRYGTFRSQSAAYRAALDQGWVPDPDDEGIFTGRVTLETEEEGTFTLEQRLIAQEIGGEWYLRVIGEKSYGQEMPEYEEVEMQRPGIRVIEPPKPLTAEEVEGWWPSETPSWFTSLNESRVRQGLAPIGPEQLSDYLGLTGAGGGTRRRRRRRRKGGGLLGAAQAASRGPGSAGYGRTRSFIEKGGPGSGHHGHAGRPGKVGGSLPKGQIKSDFDPETIRRADTMPGDCFECSAHWLVLGQGIEIEGAILAHGTVGGKGFVAGKRFTHAWVEIDDTWVYDRAQDLIMPKDDYYKLGKVENVRLYGPDQVRIKLLQTKNWGPWDEFLFDYQEPEVERMIQLGKVEQPFEIPPEKKRVPISEDDLKKISIIEERGGPGSGHHEHAGRVGEVGGSEPGRGFGRARPPEAGRRPRAVAGTAVSGPADLEPEDSQTVAQYYQSESQQFEPVLTDMMQRLAELTEGELAGLENAIKPVESLQGKIERDMLEKGISAQEAAADVNDRNRYTVVLSGEDFLEKVQQAQTDLESQGWNQYDEKYKNFFGSGDNYDGYNTVLVNAQGQRFELQYHTEDSLRVKQQIHPLYEKFRGTSDIGERRSLWQQVSDAYATIERPAGWENLPGRQVYREKPGAD